METDCILCGGCADICPENCIEIVHVAAEDLLFEQSDRSSNLPPASRADLPDQDVILIKIDWLCTRCGLCAKRCPVGAITMYGNDEFTEP